MAGVFTHNGNIVEGLPSAANMINYDNTSSGMQATQLQAAVDELNTNKQSKTDNNLATTDKTVTGSINELKSGLTNYQAQNDLNLEVPNRVNLIESLQDAYFETNGAISASNIRVSTSKIIKIPKGTYTASAVSSVSGKTVEIVVSQWENDKTDGTNTRISVSAWASSAYTFTVNNDSYVSVTCRYSDGSTTSKNDFSVQLELGSIATAYTPYIPSVESRIEAVESDVNEINSNLSNKQNATDNNLTTTSKTVVGGINELKSGFTNLDNEVNGDATVYPYADVITIPDAVPSNLADCNVKIEPVQDLHGQSAPYVGGAGKNKLPLTVDGIKALNNSGTWSGNTYTIYDVAFTVLTDVDGNVTGIKVNAGTSTGVANLFIADGMSADSISGRIMNGCPANGGADKYAIYCMNTNYGVVGSDFGDGVTLSNTEYNCQVFIQIANGYTIPTGGLTFYPMIRLATETDATFAPYTNICPISGHTEASVQRDGVNIFGGNSTSNPQYVGDYYINGGNYNWSKTTNAEHNCFDVKVIPNTTYRFVRDNDTVLSTAGQVRFLDSGKNFISGYTMNANLHTATLTTPDKCEYIEFAMGKATSKGLSINYPSNDENYYSEYAGKTYTIALGDTIYGGTLDFDSGVMTVDRAIVDMGDFTWSTPSAKGAVSSTTSISGAINPQSNYDKANMDCSNYLVLPYYVDGVSGHDANSTDGAFGIWVTDNNKMFVKDHNLAGLTAEQVKTALTGSTVLFRLATPTTIQLTPQQIQLLQGQNTLTASTGQISVTVNGVSGAIGQVQEQVNELADEVADVQNDLTALGTTIQSAGASTSGCVVKYVQIGKLVIVMANIVKGSSSWNVAHDLPRPLVSGYVGYTVDNYLPKYPLYMNDDNGNGRLQVRTGDTIASTDPVYFSYVAL